MSSLSKNVLSLMVKYRFSYSVCGKSAHTHTHTHTLGHLIPPGGGINWSYGSAKQGLNKSPVEPLLPKPGANPTEDSSGSKAAGKFHKWLL